MEKISSNLFLRSFASGATAAVLNLAILIFLTDVLKLWYIASTWIAFVISFALSFFLQKFWAFKHGDVLPNVLFKQIVLFILVFLLNLAVNTVVIFILVEYAGIWYFFAQILSAIPVTFISYTAYRLFVFNPKKF